ncbi:MAG TPA: hypothetical protein VHP11_13505 [Tepidisphaeraceae bacterium]|nr:hypothetical protein [Tepidisphaeraceae bacterium]
MKNGWPSDLGLGELWLWALVMLFDVLRDCGLEWAAHWVGQ